MGKVYTAIDRSGSYRVYLTIATDLVEEARKIHQTTPLATAGLGRVLIGAGLMGILLKNDTDKLTVQFKGDGPAKQILATSYSNGDVKGYIANPDVDLPLTKYGKLDVGGSLGLGQLTVIKDIGMKEPYMGSIDLVTGEIADDLTAYYYISEQQNTSIALGVKVDVDGTVAAAGGMFIQMLPDAKEGSIDALEAMLGELPPLTTVIEKVKAANTALSDVGLVDALAEEIFGNMPDDYKLSKLATKEIRWMCDCSEERIEKALLAVGVTDLKSIIEEDGQAELTCQFCETTYHFDKEHLERLLEAIM